MIADDERLPDDWEPEQLRIYHEVFALAAGRQPLFSHPRAEPMPDEHWKTLCHNFAFWAATTSNGDDLTVTTEDGEVLMTSETGPIQ